MTPADTAIGAAPAPHPRAAVAPWRNVFRDLVREHPFEPLRVEGRLPRSLRGVLYRNGPATFGIGGERYRHWFDGDGAICAVRIEDGQAWGAVRFVQTRWRERELRAGKQLYRSYAQLGRGWRRWFTLPKNQANISVLPWNGRLLALWEAGLPIELDPATLETVGEVDVGRTFSAHPHRAGPATFNFGVRYGRSFALDLFALDGEIRRIGRLPLRFPTIVHDFAVTQRHLIFFCPPVRLQLGRLLSGAAAFTECLAWEPERGTEVIVVPHADPQRAVRFEVPAFFQWHFVNAWDDGPDAVVVDYIRYADFQTNAWFGEAPWTWSPVPHSTYARARVQLRQRTFTDELRLDLSCEFPAIAPDDAGKPHDDAWVLAFPRPSMLEGREPPVLSRLSVRTGTMAEVSFGPDTLAGEAVLVAADDGSQWVLTQVYDGRRDLTFIAVIDAARPGDGPVVKLWFDHPVPFTFHGAWQAEQSTRPSVQ